MNTFRINTNLSTRNKFFDAICVEHLISECDESIKSVLVFKGFFLTEVVKMLEKIVVGRPEIR